MADYTLNPQKTWDHRHKSITDRSVGGNLLSEHMVDAPNRHRPASITLTQRPEEMLFGANPDVNDSARLYTNPLEASNMALEGGTPLYKTLGGRLLTQSVARGLFAAAMFTAGSYMVKEWNPDIPFGEQPLLGKPLSALQTLFDTTLSRPMESIIGVALNDPERAKHFMTFNKHFAKPYMVEQAIQGVKLSNADIFGETMGTEMVKRTFAFASGSIGAAVGRNFVAVLDPNFKTSWLKNGKIDWGDLAKSTAKEVWRIGTYYAGEDWAAAFGYAWQLRATRGLQMQAMGDAVMAQAVLEDIQNDRMGTVNRIGSDGTVGHSYEGMGAADFQMRFMGYNFYTLLYRDLYNHVGHMINHAKEQGLQVSLPKNPVHCVSETVKYLGKSLIKSQIYMAPSVLAFWPQNIAIQKQHHTFVDEKTGTPITTRAARTIDPTSMEDRAKPFMDENNIPSAHSGIYARAGALKNDQALFLGEERLAYDLSGHDPYTHHSHPMDHVINPIGKFANSYTQTLNQHVSAPALHTTQRVMSRTMKDKTTTGLPCINKVKQNIPWLTSTFARAQMAYMPYMTAKYELAQLWDTPEMDAAAYRFMDGLGGFNFREVFAGAKDVLNVVTFREVSPETQAKVGATRGPVNSRAEALNHTNEIQQAMKLERYQERMQEQRQKFQDSANNVSGFKRKPEETVSAASYEGQTVTTGQTQQL